jgi:multidrug efflux pump subunit AcrA (membrane-fusion protein)
VTVTRRRGVAVVAVATVVPFVVLAVWTLLGATRATPGSVFTVTRGDMLLMAEIEGTLQPVDAYLLGPPSARGIWNFKISRMAAEGSDVRKGTPVLSFDPSELEKRLLELGAELDKSQKEIEKKRLDIVIRQQADALRLSEAEASLEKARLKLERPAELVAARETKALELDRELAEREVGYLAERRRSLDEADRIDIESLVEQRDRASARVVELKETISRMTLVAPRDGTVVYVVDRTGEKKRVGDSVWRQEKVLSVPDLGRMSALGYVDESDSGRIALGQRVELRLDAYPEVPFRGLVAGTGKTITAPTRNSPLRGLAATVELDETDATRMRPDMRFRGKIEVGRIRDTLLVPREAVDRADGRTVMYRSGALGPVAVPVSLGRSNETLVEVLSGLSEGDRLVGPRGRAR